MYWINASVRGAVKAPGRGPGMGGPGGRGWPGAARPAAAPQGPAVTALAGDGYSASYTATLEAQRP
jgi:hypothetical protein